MRLSIDDVRETEAAAPEEEKRLTDEEYASTRRKRFASMSGKEKLQYFKDYYWIPTLIIAAVLIFVFVLVRDIRTNIPSGFDAEIVNSALWEAGELQEAFAKTAGIDPSAESCIIDVLALDSSDSAYGQASMYSAEKLMVRLAAGEIDVLAADSDTFAEYAKNGIFTDLREVLDADDLAFYGPMLAEVPIENEDGSLSDPLPLGIRLDSSPYMTRLSAYPDGGVIGIIINAPHTERAKMFLDFLFER